MGGITFQTLTLLRNWAIHQYSFLLVSAILPLPLLRDEPAIGQ
ncbi:MAG: hypothetical protein ACRC8Y_24040 [Chroococcales cyanobacterium]